MRTKLPLVMNRMSSSSRALGGEVNPWVSGYDYYDYRLDDVRSDRDVCRETALPFLINHR